MARIAVFLESPCSGRAFSLTDPHQTSPERPLRAWHHTFCNPKINVPSSATPVTPYIDSSSTFPQQQPSCTPVPCPVAASCPSSGNSVSTHSHDNLLTLTHTHDNSPSPVHMITRPRPHLKVLLQCFHDDSPSPTHHNSPSPVHMITCPHPHL